MGRARGEQDGLAEIAENADEGLVGDIGRGNLEHVHEVVEEMRGFHVKGRGQKGDARRVAVLLEASNSFFQKESCRLNSSYWLLVGSLLVSQ